MNIQGIGRRLGPVLAAFVLGVLAVVLSLVFKPYESTHDPELLASSADLRVEMTALGMAFIPAYPKATALIFYPEARVPSSAYSYLGRALVEAGYAVFVADMPLHLASLGRRRADGIRSAHPEIPAWVIGGHGLGGRVAASYAAASDVAGLVLLASAPGPGTVLALLEVLSLSGSEDGITRPAKLAATRGLLPSGSRFIEIEGGNHVQFGDYRFEEGDGEALVSGMAQRGIVVEEILAFLDVIDS